MMNKADTRLIAIGFLIAAIVMRFVPHPPNCTPIAAMALFAGCYLSGGAGIIFAFGAMAISDLLGHLWGIPGMHFYSASTTLTVYAAVALTALVGQGLKNRVSPITVPAAAIAGTAIFFLMTNFAVWLDPIMGDIYPRTAAGLAQCYIAAVPFARNQLLSDLFFSAVLFGSYAWLVSKSASPAVSSRTAR